MLKKIFFRGGLYPWGNVSGATNGEMLKTQAVTRFGHGAGGPGRSISDSTHLNPALHKFRFEQGQIHGALSVKQDPPREKPWLLHAMQAQRA